MIGDDWERVTRRMKRLKPSVLKAIVTAFGRVPAIHAKTAYGPLVFKVTAVQHRRARAPTIYLEAPMPSGDIFRCCLQIGQEVGMTFEDENESFSTVV